MDVYRCNLCVGFQAVTVQLLLNHIGRNHKNEANFHVLCGVDGCARTYIYAMSEMHLKQKSIKIFIIVYLKMTTCFNPFTESF